MYIILTALVQTFSHRNCCTIDIHSGLIFNVLYTGITEGTEVQNLTDTDVITISKKLTTLEMKELNERQRAEHAVRMYEQQKSILRDLETRNLDLEQKFAEVVII